MAGHSHDDHHVTEQKPVSFTVPFILAAVTILIIIAFLSLCDPKPHDAHHGHGSENPAHAKFDGHHNNPNSKEGDMDARIHHSDNTTTTADTVEANHPATAPASTTEAHH